MKLARTLVIKTMLWNKLKNKCLATLLLLLPCFSSASLPHRYVYIIGSIISTMEVWMNVLSTSLFQCLLMDDLLEYTVHLRENRQQSDSSTRPNIHGLRGVQYKQINTHKAKSAGLCRFRKHSSTYTISTMWKYEKKHIHNVTNYY